MQQQFTYLGRTYNLNLLEIKEETMNWKERIESYVDIEYDDPSYKGKWEITEKEDGNIHIKYEVPIEHEPFIISSEGDIEFIPGEVRYQFIDDIRQTTHCLYHKVSDKIWSLEQE